MISLEPKAKTGITTDNGVYTVFPADDLISDRMESGFIICMAVRTAGAGTMRHRCWSPSVEYITITSWLIMGLHIENRHFNAWCAHGPGTFTFNKVIEIPDDYQIKRRDVRLLDGDILLEDFAPGDTDDHLVDVDVPFDSGVVLGTAARNAGTGSLETFLTNASPSPYELASYQYGVFPVVHKKMKLAVSLADGEWGIRPDIMFADRTGKLEVRTL